MIHEVTMFSISCDNCNEDYIESHNGWSAMNDQSSIQELADNDGWHTDDEKHYCPNCFTINDEDNLILKQVTSKPTHKK